MDKLAFQTDAESLTAALDWWREAGVEHDFQDEPTCWLKPPETPASAPIAEHRPAGNSAPTLDTPAPTLDRANWPGELSAFNQWWLNAPWLDAGPAASRVPPRGQAQPEMMIIVPEPESDDGDTLLSGLQGKFLEAILSACDIGMDQVYIASVLPRRTPAADWQEIAAQGMGDVLRHHLGLVRPERLAVFGTNILALIGNDPPQGPAILRIFNHEERSIPLLAARSLEAMLERPRWKAGLWQTWLDWTATGQQS